MPGAAGLPSFALACRRSPSISSVDSAKATSACAWITAGSRTTVTVSCTVTLASVPATAAPRQPWRSVIHATGRNTAMRATSAMSALPACDASPPSSTSEGSAPIARSRASPRCSSAHRTSATLAPGFHSASTAGASVSAPRKLPRK